MSTLSLTSEQVINNIENINNITYAVFPAKTVGLKLVSLFLFMVKNVCAKSI